MGSVFVGVIELTLLLPFVGSLKAKRSIIRKVIDRTQAKFKISIAEVGDNELHQRAVIGASVVANDTAHVHTVLNKVRDSVASQTAGEADLVDIRVEVINMSFAYQR
ncbi:MAG: DUF503 domain-containing protein [Myxococcales bacterium]|nr:DUF503 domain-containing protein [Myxococcales bacterium]